MFNVSSTFTKTGLAPMSIIASTGATKVKLCMITSSSFFTPAAMSATLIAAVPDVTQQAYFTPI